ncbi:hypothetical protein Nizo2263_2951 [Lactiplantibacillus plantarum]|nr:hypothetical protein Nizo2263_2951 [Lactiplantibacillus plantarum]
MVNKLKRFGQHILSYWSYFSYGLFALVGFEEHGNDYSESVQ